MRIVVTGREGQVVRALLERGNLEGHDVVAVGRPKLDLTGPAAAILAALGDARPDVIVSAAAYTAVDKAESERDLAFAVNATGAGAVAHAAREIGVPIIHLSTDYVFDGDRAAPYGESDPTGPRTVYGASKLAGERQVLAAQPDAVILRTAWVYSPFGANFVKTMLGLADQREEVGVVADQHGNPTSALDIADGILRIAANLLCDSDPARRGIFHMTGSGEASWAALAQAIFAISGELGGPSAGVRPISSSSYPTAAPRPANSRLDNSLVERRHGIRLPDWHDALKPVVRRLVLAGSRQEEISRK